jgi:hypothetical protein
LFSVHSHFILLSSNEFPWDEGKTFKIEQRHQHDKAHMLWKRFTKVVMLNEQVRAANDLQLQQLLTWIRQGVADQSVEPHVLRREGGGSHGKPGSQQ